jgi:hypothetical protein
MCWPNITQGDDPLSSRRPNELDEAVEWYKRLSPDLGNAFLIEAIRVFRLIEQHPEAWHPMAENIRRCRLTRFP